MAAVSGDVIEQLVGLGVIPRSRDGVEGDLILRRARPSQPEALGHLQRDHHGDLVTRLQQQARSPVVAHILGDGRYRCRLVDLGRHPFYFSGTRPIRLPADHGSLSSPPSRRGQTRIVFMIRPITPAGEVRATGDQRWRIMPPG